MPMRKELVFFKLPVQAGGQGQEKRAVLRRIYRVRGGATSLAKPLHVLPKSSICSATAKSFFHVKRLEPMNYKQLFQATIPSGFATSAKMSAARSNCSRLCVALTIARNRALPSATIG